jgi:hypothetical protein
MYAITISKLQTNHFGAAAYDADAAAVTLVIKPVIKRRAFPGYDSKFLLMAYELNCVMLHKSI